MPNVGEAWYDIDARTNRLRQRLDESDRRVAQTGQRAERSLSGRLTNALGGFGSVVGGVAKAAVYAGAAGVAGLGLIGGFAIAGAASAETMQASWETLLGSVEDAQARVEELKAFAATTPFSIPEVNAASRQLQVFGGTALATGDNLRLVGDIASGTQQPFSDVAMWIGRTYDAMKNGQPFGEAAMRLQEMGALSGDGRRRLEELAAAAGDGSITMEQAWTQAQDVFGQFSGQMERQSQTLNGQISNLMDNLGQTLVGIGEILLPLAKTVVAGFNTALPVLKEFLVGVFEQAAPILTTVGDIIGDLMNMITMAFNPNSEGMAGIGQFRDQFAGLGPVVVTVVQTAQRVIGFLSERVLPPLVRAFEAIGDWVSDHWEEISAVLASGAGALGAAFGAFMSILEAVWPIIVRVGEVALPIIGHALEILLPILGVFLEVFTAIFTAVGEIVTWLVDTIITPWVTDVTGAIETVTTVIGDFGLTWESIWQAIGDFFTGLWNGLLSFFGDVIGTIIGALATVAEAAAQIPGPWQDGMRDVAASLRAMEGDVKAWGDTTNATLVTEGGKMRDNASIWGGKTAAAWGDAFAASSLGIAADVSTGLQGARNVLQAFSPPRHPMNPLRDIGKWAERTAQAYGEHFEMMKPRIAANVAGTLSLANTIRPAPGGAMAPLAMRGGGGTVNIAFHSVMPPTPIGAREVVRAIGPELRRYLANY